MMIAHIKKNEIYIKMLSLALSYIRNTQTLDERIKGKDRSCYFEAELVHNLSSSFLSSEFFEHDIWFLNHQAKYYFDNCSDDISPNYWEHLKLIRALFELVPDTLKAKLLWVGP
ncbi:zinc ABC transporter substrate-binding protein [Pseudomonas sp. CFBP13528]|uniref:zinc ABC transporter substrate-binding protein n=1 Tax=Pseudomonas sp. CFBP13528 TaxID=2184006 RepID=UPI0010C07EB6|nr:zinc ABC transporter substrate-binding protein [Pseudomonas sp. CFBP13528]TKK33432.1 zinc ABC transporter substrate-binding protein [Pseudomonas sp. CFBP13528]